MARLLPNVNTTGVERESKILLNLTRGNVVCDQVEIADKARRRMRGLLGRKSLPSGQGMLLQPAPSIHTAFMRFAIDVVFMDGTLRVNKIVDSLPPWRMASAHRAWAVLEVAAGEAQRRGISVGDQMGVVEVTDRVGAVITALDQGHRPRGSEMTDESAQSERDEFVPTLQPSSVPTEGQTETNVLIVGADRRFRSVAGALLTRRGCAVSLSDRTSNIAELALRDRADVVVVDAGLSLAAASSSVEQLGALNPRVGLVIVGDESDHDPDVRVRVVPKWDSFDVLYEAIEDARSASIQEATRGDGR